VIVCGVGVTRNESDRQLIRAVAAAGPELGVLLVLAVPAETSSGLAAAIPENSCTDNAIVAGRPTCTVTVLTEGRVG